VGGRGDTGSRERRQRYRRGHAAELRAAVLLRAKGYRILARRLESPLGEIDLVAVRGRRIAFVEVKARRTIAECEAAISQATRTRVRRAAGLWLGRNPRYQEHEQGFDVVFVIPWRWPWHIPNGL
jgi:putative endonuclease